MKYNIVQDFELDGTKFSAGSVAEFTEEVASTLLADEKISAVVGEDTAGTATTEEKTDTAAE